jgi:hypothetical protein
MARQSWLKSVSEVNAKLSSWLKKEIRPLRRRSAPTPFERKVGRALQILALLVLGAFALWRILLYSDVSRRFARVRLAGQPVSGGELNVWRRALPEAENGALVLTQAFALVRTFPDSRSNEVVEPKILSRTNVWTSATRTLVGAYIATNQPALAKVREGLHLTGFRYPVDFSYGPDTELPHLGGLKVMARMATLQAALEADAGHEVAWAENVALQLNLARTLDDEPAIISLLVRDAILRMAVKATERSLNRLTPSDEICKRIRDAFTRVSETNLLSVAFVGERTMMIPAFRLSGNEIESHSQNNDDKSKPRKRQRYAGKPTLFLWLSGLFERDLNFFLETMQTCVSMAALPAAENLALTNYLHSAFEVSQKRNYFLSGILLPSYSRVVLRETCTRSLLDLATTALAVEQFRLHRGQLPVTLTDLTPEFLERVPLDPFAGAPVRYRVLPRGYVIYSVDADGHDDGGREAPARKKSADKERYDLTFIVER